MHGGGVGLKSYCTDVENWHLHLAMFLAHKQYVVETEEMSVVETEQMFAVETRPLLLVLSRQQTSILTFRVLVCV